VEVLGRPLDVVGSADTLAAFELDRVDRRLVGRVDGLPALRADPQSGTSTMRKR
jgi:hypothetical protein